MFNKNFAFVLISVYTYLERRYQNMVENEKKLKNRGGRPLTIDKKGRIYAVRLGLRLENQFKAYLLTHNLKASVALRNAIVKMIDDDLK